MPTAQFLPGRRLNTYFLSRCLKVQFPTSLRVANDCDRCFTDNDRSWYTCDYWEPLGRKEVAWTVTKVRETTRSMSQADLVDEVYLLHNSTVQTGRGGCLMHEKQHQHSRKNEETRSKQRTR